MNITDAYTQVFFGRAPQPQKFELVLRVRGQEVSASGYARQSFTPKQWRVANGEATVTARFGPFPEGATFDEAVILADGTEIHAEKIGAASVPPGADFTWTPEVIGVT